MELSETSGAGKRRKRRLQTETLHRTNKKITLFLVPSQTSLGITETGPTPGELD